MLSEFKRRFSKVYQTDILGEFVHFLYNNVKEFDHYLVCFIIMSLNNNYCNSIKSKI